MWILGDETEQLLQTVRLVLTVAQVGACDDRSGVFYQASERAGRRNRSEGRAWHLGTSVQAAAVE